MEHFSRNWPFVRGIHRRPVNSPHEWPVTRSFDVFFDLCLNKRLRNNREAGDLRRYRAHYDVIVMKYFFMLSTYPAYIDPYISY